VIQTIPRYPVHLIDVMHLPAGTRVMLRPILPQDVELQRAFFRSLSPQSRYSRFMTRVNELPPALAERFTRIDYTSHLALVATILEDGREVMIGEARCVAEDGDPSTCELAIAVADAWQRCGIALALLVRLERQAAELGFRRMVADTLVSNRAMLGLARRTRYAVIASPADKTLARLEKTLPPPVAIAA
jgi:acetyltransferase